MKNIININRLGYGYGKVRYYDDIEYGRVYFYDYDSNDNPNLVFETSVLMLEKDAVTIINAIDEIINIKHASEYNITPFTMNQNVFSA